MPLNIVFFRPLLSLHGPPATMLLFTSTVAPLRRFKPIQTTPIATQGHWGSPDGCSPPPTQLQLRQFRWAPETSQTETLDSICLPNNIYRNHAMTEIVLWGVVLGCLWTWNILGTFKKNVYSWKCLSN